MAHGGHLFSLSYGVHRWGKPGIYTCIILDAKKKASIHKKSNQQSVYSSKDLPSLLLVAESSLSYNRRRNSNAAWSQGGISNCQDLVKNFMHRNEFL